MKARIFISYASADSEMATAIFTELERLGLQPWIDKREIKPGDSFLQKMNTGLDAAGYVVLLVSAAAHASRWVNREWLAALANQTTVLIPILLDDSGAPALLKDIVYIDARTDRRRAIEEIAKFFVLETEQPRHAVRRDIPGERQDLSGIVLTRRQLRMVATKCLDEAGLRAFCFDAEVDPNQLLGNTVHEKLVALLHTVERDGLLKRFTRWLELERSRCVTNQIEELRAAPGWDWATEC